MTLKKLTLPELLKNSCSKFSKNLSLNFVASGKKTYQDLYNEVVSIANHLLHLGVKKGDKVAILSANMPNWGITQFAIANIGAIAVPVLPGFCSTELQNILEHAEVKVIFVSRLLAKCLEGVKTPFLKHKILINNFSTIPEGCYQPEELDKLVPDISLNNTTPLPEVSIEEEDIASIIYTSGTTGYSKGVMLPYRSLWSNVAYCFEMLPVKPGDHIVSMLPMGHVFGMVYDFLYGFSAGAHIYFLTRMPSPKIISQSFSEIKPRVISCVPLIVEKIIKKDILPKVDSKIGKLLLKVPIVNDKIKSLARQAAMEIFGGNFDEIIIGGAPFNAEVEAFLKKIGFPYTIAYGMTECGPIICSSRWDTLKLASCGKATTRMEVRIDSPDPKTHAGEIVCRGANMMLGYYKNPEATAQIIDVNGWLHTGDLGVMDEEGYVTVRGRSKNMLLTSSGQNIYPEEIESKLNNMPYVAESLIVLQHDKLVALIYPDFDDAFAHGLQQNDIQKAMEVNRAELNQQLPNYCQISKIKIHFEEFEKTAKKSIKRFMYQEAKG